MLHKNKDHIYLSLRLLTPITNQITLKTNNQLSIISPILFVSTPLTQLYCFVVHKVSGSHKSKSFTHQSKPYYFTIQKLFLRFSSDSLNPINLGSKPKVYRYQIPKYQNPTSYHYISLIRCSTIIKGIPIYLTSETRFDR